MKTKLIALVCLLASVAAAQTGSYSGLGVLSQGAGAGTIGAHSGEQLDLRFFASVDGVYDTGIQPFSLDANGKLAQVNGLIGEEAVLGAYGVHSWRRAKLGLDYRGTYRHYQGSTFFDGSDQALQLGYSYQPTRKFSIDMRAVAGTSSFGLSGPATNYTSTGDGTVVTQPTLLLFDNRTYYLESGVDGSILPTSRITITVGGSGYFIDHQAKGLINVEGYTLHGSLMYRLNRDTSIGPEYMHQHYEYPGNFGQSNINVYTGRINRDFGRRWSASLSGGMFSAQVQGLQTVSFDPVIAALLGVSSGTQAFYINRYFPAGDARLVRKFRSAQLSLAFALGATPGNGVYLTSRQDSGSGSFSYTGVRKWSFSVGGNYAKLTTIGQGLAPYTQKTGSVGATYEIFRDLHATARFDGRDQTISVNGYVRASYRASVGLSFSPGTIPLSLW
ncbi:MAG TPA: hypothetical protein VN841_30585 [Bryobacteraceae bacterium]|nr:hypothetical protein [Bryobacteraceae bacterium]